MQSKTKKAWWFFHLILLLLWFPIFIYVGVMLTGWGLSTPSSDTSDTYKKVVTFLSISVFILLFYPILLIGFAFFKRKTLSTRPTLIMTGIVLCFFSVSFAFYLTYSTNYKKINNLMAQEIITPSDLVNDYVCQEEDGNVGFFSFKPEFETFIYTGLRANGSFRSGIIEYSSTTMTILIKANEAVGAEYQWKTEPQKRTYLQTCINKQNQSILDTFNYNEKDPQKI